MNKNIFKTTTVSKVKPADVKNEAGGKAYSLSSEKALANMACTGCFNGVYYSSAETQMKTYLELASQCHPDFVAKCAIYARQSGHMKDAPVVLLAYLSTVNSEIFTAAFPKVIQSVKDIRNFVQVMRSGVVGRKSLGTGPKKLVKNWLDSRTELSLFRSSIGTNPSLNDVIKMVHPRSNTAERDALFKYFLGKNCDMSKLPEEVQAFEAFKKGEGELPNVPFEMLTALSLKDSHWAELAKNMTWTQLRMNLATLARHNVFNDSNMEKFVAEKLADKEQVKRAKVFPYQLMSAFMHTDSTVPVRVKNALQDAMEHAIENVPSFDGDVKVFVDISGSMHSPATGNRGTVTSKVRCIDVAGLVAASILRKNQNAEVIPFGTDVVPVTLNSRDSVMTNAEKLARMNGGGTNCGAPFALVNQRKSKVDLIILLSDNMSWQSTQKNSYYGGTQVMQEWEQIKRRNPKAKLINMDITPYTSSQTESQKDILMVGGFSDAVFNVMHSFMQSDSDDHWVDVIKATEL